MPVLNRYPLLRRAALLALAVPAMSYAHPGHGLGPIGHGLQHMAWNFLGTVILAAALLAGDRVLHASLKRAKVRLLRYAGKARQFLAGRNPKN